MAEQRSTDEKIAELDKKIKQIKAQKKAIIQREKQAERKARTKRLIQIGAEVESICGEITDLEAFKDYLCRYGYAIRKTQLAKNDTHSDHGRQESSSYADVSRPLEAPYRPFESSWVQCSQNE